MGQRQRPWMANGGLRTGLGQVEKGLSLPRRWKAEEAEEAAEAYWFLMLLGLGRSWMPGG